LNPSYDGNSLSLFLKMKKTNDVPKGSGSLVEFALSIKDQENGKDRKYPGSRFSGNLLDGLVSLDARLSWHVLNFFFVVVVKCRQVPVLEQTPSLGMEEVHLAGGLQGLVKGLSHQGQVLHRG
jgi:hypothetical protein